MNSHFVGSGAEDIGANVLQPALTPLETASRKAEDAHKAADRAAIDRRVDRDRIIRVALDEMEASPDFDYCYLAGAAEIPLGHGRPNRADYVRDLLAEIRAELSPLVR